MYTPNGTVWYPFLKNLTTWVASLLQQSCFILPIHEEVIPVHNRAIHNKFCDSHDPLCVFTVKFSYDNCLRDPIYHANVVLCWFQNALEGHCSIWQFVRKLGTRIFPIQIVSNVTELPTLKGFKCLSLAQFPTQGRLSDCVTPQQLLQHLSMITRPPLNAQYD